MYAGNCKSFHHSDLVNRVEKKKHRLDHVDVASTYNNLGFEQSNLDDLGEGQSILIVHWPFCLTKLRPDRVDVKMTSMYIVKKLGKHNLGDLEQ